MSNPQPDPNTFITIPTHSRRRTQLSGFPVAKPIPLAISIAVGLIVCFAIPKPSEVSKQAWRLFAIFLTTIAGLILGPLPVGAWAFVCLTITVITRTLKFKDAFAAFTNEVIWLIVVSFFFSRGFVKTGLGDRMAMYFVRWLGKSTLGLAYGLAICEAIISPAMPSTTARAGGIFLPIINSLAIAAESRPKDGSARKLGAYLIQSQFQSSSSSSALFLTAAAQNMLCIKLADSLGVKIKSPWVSWFKASCLPAVASLMLTPFIVYKIFPPEIKHTADAPVLAKNKLEEMGPVKRDEWIMLGTMLVTVSLWIAGESLDMSSVIAAMLGLSVLLILGVLTWDDCLSEKSAWDTLAWFAVLIGMASQLTTLGVVPWLSKCVASFLKSLSVGWPVELLILQSVYFFIHYMFAGQTAHVGALYSAFLSMHLTAKVPKTLSALALAFNTNLFGALTHYSSGQAAVYYGAGYVKLPDVFKLGILMAIINITIWGVIGTPWWKILGLY
ncbi:putative solute carrier family 13 [Helianthus annuus]|uniref:Putative sodium/sulfate symporter n=1 Tax=Helianthus annuus TaxID=4232 RepID=A0A251S614_HELAN|nr:dicarboxylate transporter 2.1, chloroplastic [Helianthus annuus]KAF5763264.1 putative solute carrier family 13 [Helianthus annuus]KAJ0454153.1 putative solute carrier family 13 [Helianthus annuus]KAJ0471946.1 putative solute carrier family 13 [Helianthus annuus]KAJ0647545.1 putative solute carrier family 13 [Helianthus annuus]KAJ0651425.1 putative solute carrier family 13 [Helianthus annuus]